MAQQSTYRAGREWNKAPGGAAGLDSLSVVGRRPGSAKATNLTATSVIKPPVIRMPDSLRSLTALYGEAETQKSGRPQSGHSSRFAADPGVETFVTEAHVHTVERRTHAPSQTRARPASAADATERHLAARREQAARMADEDQFAAIVLRDRLECEQQRVYQRSAESALRRMERPNPLAQPSAQSAGAVSEDRFDFRSSAAAAKRPAASADEGLMWASIRQRALEEQIQALRTKAAELR